ncbi:hypothetical protein MSPP1_000226 [Malassezia sp. CBS 17886]|nr:hypothetical protein MSPP1_000226 [Malassezia sp. CBS 17886]
MAMDIRLVKGPKGDKVKFIVWHGGRKHLACLRTAQAVVANMIKGVTVGFQYKMRAVYAHFPINLIIAGDNKSVEIRNFLGEKRVRKVDMAPGVTIQDDKAQKDQVLVEGVRVTRRIPCLFQNDIDAVSQCAALLHGVTLVRNKDIRKLYVPTTESSAHAQPRRYLLHCQDLDRRCSGIKKFLV